MTPLERSALAAEEEALSLLAEAQHAMTLEETSDLLWNVATDAIEAYERARKRAADLRQLADHSGGAYNAFEEAS